MREKKKNCAKKGAADAADLSSSRGDAVKNALLAAVSLHGALTAGTALVGKIGFGDGDASAPTPNELAVVVVDASARAAAFLSAHGDDPDASVFEAFLDQHAPRPAGAKRAKRL